MNSILVAVAVTSTFTLYPGFVEPKSQIEAVRDIGPVLELIVKCPLGNGMMSYSKVDKKFCTADWTCYRDPKAAIAHLCK